ncbi:MAG: hypothetical protein H6732_14375 [Alphaproteobacteria bacterium]|nr:hypothetical protein [Alphaproteobacteria bacterium]
MRSTLLACLALVACAPPVQNTFDTLDTSADTDRATPADSEAPPPRDADGDGYPVGLDCLDGNPNVNPGVPERCNGIDDDCDDLIDQGPDPVIGTKLLRPLYQDIDQDGWGNPGTARWFCDRPGPGWVPRAGDCDDLDANIRPDAPGSSCPTPAPPADTGLWGDTDAVDTAPVPPNCGDGVLDSDERCDDDNTTGGDGCSHRCTRERFTITIVRADIAETKPGGASWDFLTGLPPDPYVSGLINGTEVLHTELKLDNITPVWGTNYAIEVRSAQSLELIVYDHDDASQDDVIGTFTLSHDVLNADVDAGDRTAANGSVKKFTYRVVAR